MDKYLFLGKVLKKLHLKKIGLSINGFFKKKIKAIDNPEEKLEIFFSDKGKSCITQNKIANIYDVQVIMPVFNAEKTLRQAIESVLSQKGLRIHLTIVNDGSYDKSNEILEEYTHHPGIEIITQSNKGLSAARNAALKDMKAKYITFLDSDDYLIDDALKTLFEKAEKTNCDIIQGSFMIINHKRKRRIVLPNRDSDGIMLGFACGKLIRSELFKNIEFPEGYWFEDTVMSVMLYPLIPPNKKVSISIPVYCYRDNPEGITRTAQNRNKKIIDTVWVTRRLYYDRCELGLPMKRDEYYQFLKQVITNISRIDSYGDKNLTNIAIGVMKKYKETFFSEYEITIPEFAYIHNALINNQGSRLKFLCGLLKQ